MRVSFYSLSETTTFPHPETISVSGVRFRGVFQGSVSGGVFQGSVSGFRFRGGFQSRFLSALSLASRLSSLVFLLSLFSLVSLPSPLSLLSDLAALSALSARSAFGLPSGRRWSRLRRRRERRRREEARIRLPPEFSDSWPGLFQGCFWVVPGPFQG